MANVAQRVFRHAPAFMRKWTGQIDAREHVSSVERAEPMKHGARRGAVHGAPYGALHKPRYEMGSPLGRYGRHPGARAAASWPHKKQAPPRKRWGRSPHPGERRLTARLRARRAAFVKRTRSSYALGKQDMRRWLAKAVLLAAALARVTTRFGRWMPLAHLLHLAHLTKAEPHHTPLGHRTRKTNLRAAATPRKGQLTFAWVEGEPHPVKEPPAVHHDETAAESGGSTAYRRGYQSPDAQLKAHELHFDQSNARAIHGSISSASRHAQGKRDHRGA